MYSIGVDIGGTFTDVVLFDEDSKEVKGLKTPSKRNESWKGVVKGMSLFKVSYSDVNRLCYGTTVALNTIIEKKGPITAGITTKGFRDILEIGWGTKFTLFDIYYRKPQPVIPRNLIFEADERILANGDILVDLDEQSVLRIIEKLKEHNVESVAICLLHAYINPVHEIRIKELIEKELPHLFLSVSHEVICEVDEYARFNTTAFNSYAGPSISNDIDLLNKSLKKGNFDGTINLMTSNGGSADYNSVKKVPVKTLLSGPIGGVSAAIHFAHLIGEPNLITCDMGGTSTDVSLIDDYKPTMVDQRLIAGGLPDKTYQVEINSIGAGGGSIFWIDSGNIIQVGPQSAGALPGPSCYGLGGKELTVTDVNVFLNRMPVDTLGGKIKIDRLLAHKALQRLSDKFPEITLNDFAEGLLKLVATKMANSIKEISVFKGKDPRDYALIAFGGAGPMHATEIADILGIEKIYIPPLPGNFSALGALLSNVRYEFSKSKITDLEDFDDSFNADVYSDLDKEAKHQLEKYEKLKLGNILFSKEIDMRHKGQFSTIRLDISNLNTPDIKDAFFAQYKSIYGHVTQNRSIEIVNFRLIALEAGKKKTFNVQVKPKGMLSDSIIGQKKGFFDGKYQDIKIFSKDLITANNVVKGPVIIKDDSATIVISSGWRAVKDVHGALRILR